ncbi:MULTISPECIES: DUF6916 family protein [Pseudomonas]|uniref:DUF6916 domain-containing protein n=1 Tax=Pseudomonas cichorii TaxID=36746 RepID=A0A3M4VWT3_PSECI|nr:MULTISPECIES: hypothetical protein [Pseudomonas]AHF69943.1 hypothetical protein PCH70_47900 [Pseudomonas cichorii JBC1]QVE16837.1 hypothetical protein KGD89_23910 [Pseudomonas cichorii]RMR56234.1 hypothetical protein ALP84_03483 [Pseudomonas cichorii]SDP07925.1 hypothetical protein SAMN05216599_11820 [Pseudomonas cichorii]GFM78855.1 hypothetical protein PSCICM_46740 [Pseudomonas cichorii]
MLQDITVEHFRTLLGSTCSLQLDDGSQLPIAISSIDEKPLARLSDNQRLPFSISLNSLEPSAFVDGLCALELPELGRLEEIFVSRVPPMGRDANLAYYCISFN